MMRLTARSTSQQCCSLLVAGVLEVVALVHCNRIPWLWQWARVLNRWHAYAVHKSLLLPPTGSLPCELSSVLRFRTCRT